mmetsp:Transcript_11785/g.32116  ORF Transcript_11785/g.32116 Transcript_11785/m.32116 type:complete len:242 (-) Transcript_11785:1652-2377(-)
MDMCTDSVPAGRPLYSKGTSTWTGCAGWDGWDLETLATIMDGLCNAAAVPGGCLLLLLWSSCMAAAVSGSTPRASVVDWPFPRPSFTTSTTRTSRRLWARSCMAAGLRCSVITQSHTGQLVACATLVLYAIPLLPARHEPMMMTWGLGALRVVSEEVSRLPGLRLRCAHRSAMLRRCRSRVSLWVGVCSSRPHTVGTTNVAATGLWSDVVMSGVWKYSVALICLRGRLERNSTRSQYAGSL